MCCLGLKRLLGKKPTHEKHVQPANTAVANGAAGPRPAQRDRPVKATDASLSKETPARDESLWDQAYNKLDPGLIKKYEELLAKQRQEISEKNDNSCKNGTNRQQDLDLIIEHGLHQAKTQRTDVQEGLAQAADWILSVKDFIEEAVKASPEASLAWAGVCIVLPLLTNPQSAAQANKSGFTYVTGRIRYHIELERILWSTSSRSSDHTGLKEQFNANIVKLYQEILHFEVKSVLRFHRSWQRNFAGDIFQPEDWNGMVSSIKDLEKLVQQDAATISTEVSRRHLKEVEQSTRHNFESMQKLLPLAQRHLEVDIEALNLQRQMHEEALSVKEQECRQLFRLARNEEDSSYELYKSRVDNRVEGTCEWFLEQPHFNQWLDNDRGLLIVSAGPGCGKSVLAKHLVDNVLLQCNPSATICYFFFKDGDQNTQKQAICAMLHQIFTKKPELIKLAMNVIKDNGKETVNVVTKLWEIFSQVIKDPAMGQTIFVLDALDECKDSELVGLTDNIKSTQNDGGTRARFLLTSRPYENVISEFRELIDHSPHIHIPAENESDKIGQEVNIVIKHRVERLARKKGLSAPIQSYLEKRLLRMEHRTYLWVHLVFEYFETHSFEKVKQKIDRVFIDKLPKNVNDSYYKILLKSEDMDMARKAFCIMLAASRPLTLTEMNIAVNLDLDSDELDLESDEDFQASLRSWCGLLLTVNNKKVFFLHQTAREFLAQENGFGRCSERGPIDPKEAQSVLATSCITYIDKFMPRAHRTSSTEDLTSININSDFSEYSADEWLSHFRAAALEDDEKLQPILTRICDPKTDAFASWCEAEPSEDENRNTLWMAAKLGLTSVVKRILQNEDIEDAWGIWAQRISHVAASCRNVEVLNLLLDCEKLDWNMKDTIGFTPLFHAITSKHVASVRCLLDSGKVDVRDEGNHGTPLIFALRYSSDEIVEMLFHTEGIDMNGFWRGCNALTVAVHVGRYNMVKMLLDMEAVETNPSLSGSKTPLVEAVMRNDEAIVRLLLDSGRIDLNQQFERDGITSTALKIARLMDRPKIVEMLVKAGAVE
ncbi:ankyrin repeat protein [Aspergillus eucalypticola CBS 122712]|uniref:Ankyrin repeat protein n=1 Tax=Aspergillus eucalypticola (strain CBS 122712 / IBT 29274) TaxID=1448314 RepID=A0A317VAV1_ASPEC|nr:ankyrin repeat protein [Aspergillus eucalypticola CBS 122712]PWY70108.1 ankyrin repeat protein [Aspergillus eucalypticola CBS 122712]